MATITLKYDKKNPNAVKTLDYILSMGFFEEAENPSESDYPYDRKFADKLIESRKSKGVKIEDADLWK